MANGNLGFGFGSELRRGWATEDDSEEWVAGCGWKGTPCPFMCQSFRMAVAVQRINLAAGRLIASLIALCGLTESVYQPSPLFCAVMNLHANNEGFNPREGASLSCAPPCCIFPIPGASRLSIWCRRRWQEGRGSRNYDDFFFMGSERERDLNAIFGHGPGYNFSHSIQFLNVLRGALLTINRLRNPL